MTKPLPTVEDLRVFVELPDDSATHIENLENALRRAHELLAMPPEEVGTWIEASERLPKLGELVVIWDADWRDQFIKRIKDGMAWDTKRYTHWHPCSREPQKEKP